MVTIMPDKLFQYTMMMTTAVASHQFTVVGEFYKGGIKQILLSFVIVLQYGKHSAEQN